MIYLPEPSPGQITSSISEPVEDESRAVSLYPELDELTDTLTMHRVVCYSPNDVAVYRWGLIDHFKITDKDSFNTHPVIWIAGDLTSYGYPCDLAARVILKAAVSWPICPAGWFSEVGSSLYRERLDRIKREATAQARIASRRQGVPLQPDWQGDYTNVVPLPGLWAWATEYLVRLLEICIAEEKKDGA